MCICVHAYVTTISKKIKEFETMKGKIYGRVCREEKERGTDVIILCISKKKRSNFKNKAE